MDVKKNYRLCKSCFTCQHSKPMDGSLWFLCDPTGELARKYHSGSKLTRKDSKLLEKNEVRSSGVCDSFEEKN